MWFRHRHPSGSGKVSNPSEQQKTHVRALDGLRGIACLIVFNEHVSYNWTYAWLHGHNGQIFERPLFQLPFIRLLWLGNSAVNLFFLMSGYVLSYKFLKQVYVLKDERQALRHILSSALKRFPRLYIPTITAGWTIAIMSYIGMYEISRRRIAEGNNKWELHEMAPPRHAKIRDHWNNVWRDCAQVMHFWSMDMHHSMGDFDQHTWSIRTEMTCSMILFFSLAATVRMQHMHRIATFCVLGLLSAFAVKFPLFCFYVGALTAMWEIHGKQQSILPITTDEKGTTSIDYALLSPRMGFFLVVFGAYIASAPIGRTNVDPFFNRLIALFPPLTGDESLYIRTIGAVFIFWAVVYWSPLTKAFSSRIPAYLGKVSFAFYLCHGPIIRLVFQPLLCIIYEKLGDGVTRPETWTVRMIAWLVAWLTCLPMSVWIAGYFEKYVDRPTIKLCQKIVI